MDLTNVLVLGGNLMLQNMSDDVEDVEKYAAGQPRNTKGQFASGGGGGITLDGEKDLSSKIHSAEFWVGENKSRQQLKDQVVADLTDSMNEAGVGQFEWEQAYTDLHEGTGIKTLDPWDESKSVYDIQLIRNEGDGNYTKVSLADAMSYYDVAQGKQTYTVDETKAVLEEFRAKAIASGTAMSGNEANVGALPELAFTERGQRLIQESVVNDLVGKWALSSNDSDVVSHAIQETTKDVFKLKGTAEWRHNTAELKWKLLDRTQFAKQVDEFKVVNGNVLQSFVKAQHANTQAFFADKGITKVVLYRGLTGSVGLRTGAGEVDLRPMSSWTTYTETAMRFSQPSLTQPSTVLRTTVDVKDIIATPFTGVGCHNEFEMVILGGVREVDYKETGLIPIQGWD